MAWKKSFVNRYGLPVSISLPIAAGNEAKTTNATSAVNIELRDNFMEAHLPIAARHQ